MSDNSFLEQIRQVNQDYHGIMNSITFIVQRGVEEKKIFKWIFAPGNTDFYISFPYYHCEQYYCGTIEIPQLVEKDETFDAVKSGVASKVPVKFSYHKDGNVHFKPTNHASDEENKGFKLATLKVEPIDQLNGSQIFTIRFEGLSKFDDLKKHRKTNGDQEVLLPVAEDIINFEIQAFAGTSEESLCGQIKPGSIPWFQVSGKTREGKPVFIGVYAILSRISHIIDQNKNGLHVLVGFDRSKVNETGRIKSLYLFAR